jgi:hypothetical protein
MSGVRVPPRPPPTPLGHATPVPPSPQYPSTCFAKVLLVVLLGVVERARGGDLGGDLAVAGGPQLALVPVPAGPRQLRLLVGGGVDGGAVLGADVVALPHALGGVVGLPEDAEQLLVGQDVRVEGHEDDLGVAGETRAHLLVGGVRGGAALIADGRDRHARGLPEAALGTPEAPEAEVRDLRPGGEGRGEASAVHVVGRTDRHRGASTGQSVVRCHHPGLFAPEEVSSEGHGPRVRRQPAACPTVTSEVGPAGAIAAADAELHAQKRARVVPARSCRRARPSPARCTRTASPVRTSGSRASRASPAPERRRACPCRPPARVTMR